MKDALLRIALEAPGWLWLLAVCGPAVWITTLVWPIGMGGARWAAAVTRTLLLAGLIVALARPVRITELPAISAVALFDVSASVSDDDLARERRLARDLVDGMRPPHELRLVRFAAAPSEIDAGGIARPVGDAGLATDIARALGLAAGLGDPTRARRILLISDGRPTRGDALAQAARLAALGIRVDTMLLGATVAARGDVAIEGLEAPPDIRPHATFPLLIRIAADRAATVHLTLRRDGRLMDDGDARVEPAGQTRGAETSDEETEAPRVGGGGGRAFAVAAGTTTVRWNVRVDSAAPAVFSAQVGLSLGPGLADSAGGAGPAGRSADGRAAPLARPDAHPENDRGVLAIAVRAPPRVLLLAGATADAEPLARALEAQSMDAEIQAPTRLLDAAVLARSDLVVLCDLPRGAIPDSALGALDAFVRDGGGLLVTGGPRAFGPGNWEGSPLEPMLPVRLDLPQRRDEPALALAIIIDRSGSMSGAKMDLTKRAARATAEMLPPDDQIAVIAFDSQASTIVPLQRAANRLRIATDIGRIQPTGGTNILAGLRDGLEQLSGARAKKKHAILLSDGQSPSDGIVELVDAASSSRITISTIGVGDGVDDGLMQQIAGRGGGRYYHTRDPASIPRIFTREASEVAATGIIERPTAVVAQKRATMLEGIPLTRAPRLGGYVRTHQRPGAELLLVTDGGDPLLARWPVGLGQVAAWTSDLGPRWAESWARWPPWGKFWGQLARATMRARAARQFPLVVRVDGGIAEVDVEAVGLDDSAVSGLEADLVITEVTTDGAVAAGLPRHATLTESAPGRYEARFPIATEGRPDPGALLLRAVLTRDGRPLAEANGHLSIPSAAELRPAAARSPESSATGADVLGAIASRTGGGPLRSPEDLFRGAPPRPLSRPLRTQLLVVMAVLLVADVAVRRRAMAARPRRPSTGSPPHANPRGTPTRP